jgi:hypothetical protein
VSLNLKKLYIYILFCLILTNFINLQKSFSSNSITSNSNNTSILPGYIECFIEYKSSKCNECPPSCLSMNSKNIIIENKNLSNKIDQIFEKSLRQISIVKSGIDRNSTYASIIYLQSLYLKNQINIDELKIIDDVIKNIQNADSIISIGKDIKEKLNILIDEENSSPIAISILNITSKSIDLLINSDFIILKNQGNPNLMFDLSEQKKWILKILSNTIIGCEISGMLGCLTSAIFTTGIS